MNRQAEARFGRFFDELLAHNDLTAAEAARRLHVAQSQVSRWRRGEGGLSYESMKRISDVFGIDLTYLQQLTDSEYSGPRVYRSHLVDPDVAMSWDMVQARVFARLAALSPAEHLRFMNSLQGQVDVVADLLEKPAKVQTRRKASVSLKPDRVTDRDTTAPLRRPRRPAPKQPADPQVTIA